MEHEQIKNPLKFVARGGAFSVYFKFALHMFACRFMCNLEQGVSLLTVTILLLLFKTWTLE